MIGPDWIYSLLGFGILLAFGGMVNFQIMKSLPDFFGIIYSLILGLLLLIYFILICKI